MSLETIVPTANGKFGPKVGDIFYSFSKFFKGDKQLEVGTPVSVDVFTSDSGKKYINAIVGAVLNNEVPKTPVKKSVVVAAKSETMSKADWSAKDRSQLVGGRSHDAVELVNVSLVTGTSLEDVLKLYQEALEGVLKVAEEVK